MQRKHERGGVATKHNVGKATAEYGRHAPNPRLQQRPEPRVVSPSLANMRFQLLSLLILPFLATASSDEQMVFPPPLGSGAPFTRSKPTLADLLTIESSVSIFYSYARETEISRLFDDVNARSTLLVPTNRAVMALARKPHQDPAPVDEGVIISEEEFDARSKKNVERWVSAHIIPRSPISLESSSEYETLLEGKNVSFKQVNGDTSAPAWSRVRLNDDIRLTAMKECASNGVMYIIDGTVKTD
ncbi:hypothetical protein A0H81_01350 [Grifola frondosa]|uniref:FAS1 domain-containing protein n=1 Tax=Grifola frondosa TaxID=5627 RepID=A0A1C7MPS8_GRIFR|nr:hypothetical protein A0H81_01350 [Grifola frondosa]